jgi:hypothetical protein
MLEISFLSHNNQPLYQSLLLKIEIKLLETATSAL